MIDPGLEGRVALATDQVAEVVVFFASQQARYVTGNIVRMH